MTEITLNGICIAHDVRALILTGAGAEEVATRSKWAVVARGKVTLTLGVALFDRPFVFTPRSIITERNQTIEGERVFDWLPESGYRMPRSEVFGLNVHGRESQIFARDIDIEASPIAVLDYGTWVLGIVEIDLAAPDRPQCLNRPDLPDRFRTALSCYCVGPGVKLEELI